MVDQQISILLFMDQCIFVIKIMMISAHFFFCTYYYCLKISYSNRVEYGTPIVPTYLMHACMHGEAKDFPTTDLLWTRIRFSMNEPGYYRQNVFMDFPASYLGRRRMSHRSHGCSRESACLAWLHNNLVPDSLSASSTYEVRGSREILQKRIHHAYQDPYIIIKTHIISFMQKACILRVSFSQHEQSCYCASLLFSLLPLLGWLTWPIHHHHALRQATPSCCCCCCCTRSVCLSPHFLCNSLFKIKCNAKATAPSTPLPVPTSEAAVPNTES